MIRRKRIYFSKHFAIVLPLIFLTICLELTRTYVVFSRIAYGVFLLCRVEKFAENSRKIRKGIFERKIATEPEDQEGGPPQEQGRVPLVGGVKAAGGGRPCPWSIASRPPFAYKLSLT